MSKRAALAIPLYIILMILLGSGQSGYVPPYFQPWDPDKEITSLSLTVPCGNSDWQILGKSFPVEYHITGHMTGFDARDKGPGWLENPNIFPVKLDIYTSDGLPVYSETHNLDGSNTRDIDKTDTFYVYLDPQKYVDGAMYKLVIEPYRGIDSSGPYYPDSNYEIICSFQATSNPRGPSPSTPTNQPQIDPETQNFIDKSRELYQQIQQCKNGGGTWIDQGNLNGYCQPQSSQEQQCNAAGGTMQNGQCIVPMLEEMKRMGQCQNSGGTWVNQPNFDGYCQSITSPAQQPVQPVPQPAVPQPVYPIAAQNITVSSGPVRAPVTEV